jgi:hypothetical protein
MDKMTTNQTDCQLIPVEYVRALREIAAEKKKKSYSLIDLIARSEKIRQTKPDHGQPS